MSERVDHVAEARRELEFADSQFPVMNRAPGGVAFEKAFVSAVQAQTHATLALVEQQRIANKLAVALVDQLTEIAPYLTPRGAVANPRIGIRDYLHTDEWEGLDL